MMNGGAVAKTPSAFTGRLSNARSYLIRLSQSLPLLRYVFEVGDRWKMELSGWLDDRVAVDEIVLR